jgi:hypothetical protein
MKLTQAVSIALKEWAAVCQAVQSSRQIILLRKGGIYESAGEFQVEHPRFLLFPTYLHQNLKMLKAEAHEGFQPHSSEPAKITLSSLAQVTDIIELKHRKQMDALDAEHIWTPPLIHMRFSYRPENPLYLLIVRAYRLNEPATVDNTPAYAGCKSWVPLERGVATTDASPALNDDPFEHRRRTVLRLLEPR